MSLAIHFIPDFGEKGLSENIPPLVVVIANNEGALRFRASEYKVRDWMYTTPLAADTNAMRIIALTKWADDSHPASVNPMVNGEEAVLDPG